MLPDAGARPDPFESLSWWHRAISRPGGSMLLTGTWGVEPMALESSGKHRYTCSAIRNDWQNIVTL